MAKSPLLFWKVKPAATIMPSRWIATARAASSFGLKSIWRKPPLPKVGSGSPSLS